MNENSKQSWLRSAMLTAPAVLSMIVLAAHFLRSGNLVLTIPCFLSPLLLLSKRNWVNRILQGALFAGGLIWVNTAMTIYKARVASDQPWGRMAIILSCVALFALASVLLLEIKISKMDSAHADGAKRSEKESVSDEG